MDSDINNTIEIVKKKRGRKPKNKDNTEPVEIKIPKKRGRKPTGKILKSSELSTLKNDEDCIIAHIPLKNSDIERLSKNSKESSLEELDSKISNVVKISEDSDTELSLNDSSINELSLDHNSLANKKQNFNDKYIYHLEDEIKKLKIYVKDLEEERNTSEIFFGDYSVEKLESKIIINKDDTFVISKETNILCWWCCHSFDNIPFLLPDKYYLGKFYVLGNFCSPSCACAYNIDVNDHKLWERNSLILKLYNELTDNNIDKIYPAPPKQILESFGGNINIEAFRRKTNTTYSGRFIIPPMVPLTTLIEESYKDRNKYKWETKVNISKYNNLKKNINIKRTITTSKNSNLEKIMGLKKIKIEI